MSGGLKIAEELLFCEDKLREITSRAQSIDLLIAQLETATDLNDSQTSSFISDRPSVPQSLFSILASAHSPVLKESPNVLSAEKEGNDLPIESLSPLPRSSVNSKPAMKKLFARSDRVEDFVSKMRKSKFEERSPAPKDTEDLQAANYKPLSTKDLRLELSPFVAKITTADSPPQTARSSYFSPACKVYTPKPAAPRPLRETIPATGESHESTPGDPMLAEIAQSFSKLPMLSVSPQLKHPLLQPTRPSGQATKRQLKALQKSQNSKIYRSVENSARGRSSREEAPRSFGKKTSQPWSSPCYYQTQRKSSTMTSPNFSLIKMLLRQAQEIKPQEVV